MARPELDRRKVWITRTEPGAGRTAARVQALGFTPLAAPLLAIEPTGVALSLEPFESLALTSSQAIAALGPEVSRAAQVFAVGEATAKAARAAGFTKVLSANGDVHGLAEVILKANPAAVVHPAASRAAGDLVGQLTEAGLMARRVVVYRTTPGETLPPEIGEAFAEGAISALLLHSPLGGEIAAALLSDAGISPSAAPALGLSLACVRPLSRRGFTVLAAIKPNEGALMALLKATI